MSRDKCIILNKIKELETKLALLTIKLENKIKEEDRTKRSSKKKELTLKDFKKGDKVKILTMGTIQFDPNKAYPVVGSTPEQVVVRVERETLSQAPKNLKKIE